jgi:antitoxin YefM
MGLLNLALFRESSKNALDNPFHGQHPVHVNAISYTAARENLAATMDRVCTDHDPVIVTRKRNQSVVILSLEDYESLQETAYLLRSPVNAARLCESILELDQGKGVFKKLEDLPA